MKKVIIFSLSYLCFFAYVHAQNYHGTARYQYKPKQNLTYSVPDTNMISIAKVVYKLVNDYRASHGLETLKMQKELNDIAFEHSHLMAQGKIPFSHLDFHERVKKIDKYAYIPYRTAENLYAHKIDIKKFSTEALKGWINSPGHKKNMEGAFIHTGLGVCRSKTGELFVTQIFVGKASFLLAGAKGIEELEEDLTTGLVSPKSPVEE